MMFSPAIEAVGPAGLPGDAPARLSDCAAPNATGKGRTAATFGDSTGLAVNAAARR
jgi:hypothetical protein